MTQTTTRMLNDFVAHLDEIVRFSWEAEDFAKANCYAKDIEAGDRFPPITVFDDHVRDGFHRLYAYRKLGYEEIAVIDLAYDPESGLYFEEMEDAA